MVMRFTILGCGSSPGTPRIGGDWGQCNPDNPKNRRSRAAFLVERFSDEGVTRVVVDTGPDFRQQMIDANVDFAETIVYTHAHADHIHGIDDLRGFAINRRQRINIYADQPTLKRLQDAFGYCFKTPEGGFYPPILEGNLLVAGEALSVDGPGGQIEVLPFTQTHGNITSLGFRFGDVAYSSDISDVPDSSLPALEGLKYWVVDALQYREHPSHFSLDQALHWIGKLKPQKAILTHMHTPLDYDEVRALLPEHVVPAYDGLQFEA